MKTKEKKIKAWLEFIQANLDDLSIDKKISLIYGIFEDVFFNRPPFPLESPDSHEPVDSLEKFREVVKILDEPEWEEFMLREVQHPLWRDLQIETKKYLEEILLGPRQPVGTDVYEYLIEKPSGVFRKGSIPKKFAKAGMPALRDLLDGVPKSAFKRCPECERWFFHTSKREKIYCSNRCASRYLTRKSRTESEEAKEEYRKKMKVYMEKRRKSNPGKRNKHESEWFSCPGNPDDPLDVQITSTECITPDGKNIRGIFHACPACPHFLKRK